MIAPGCHMAEYLQSAGEQSSRHGQVKSIIRQTKTQDKPHKTERTNKKLISGG